MLWVLDVRSTVGAPDWARVQFKIRVLKWWKCFYVKHTEGNIRTDVLHYELRSDFSVSLWISFQFHRQHLSSVMFWSCVISVEMSVCSEEMLRNYSVDLKEWTESFDELSDLTLSMFLSFPSTCGPFLRTGSVFQIWTDRWKTNFTVEPLHQNSAQLHPAGFISQLFAAFLII